MSESFVITILGIAGVILSGVISFILGQRAERQKQSLLIRAEMLKPINEWLKGGEKMVVIFSDTISTIAQNIPLPMNYDFNDRKKAFNFMAEKKQMKSWALLLQTVYKPKSQSGWLKN